jgi:hypothetical protein
MSENIVHHARRLEGEIGELRDLIAEQQATILALQQRLAILEQQAAQKQA